VIVALTERLVEKLSWSAENSLVPAGLTVRVLSYYSFLLNLLRKKAWKSALLTNAKIDRSSKSGQNAAIQFHSLFLRMVNPPKLTPML
jgi:hypothetical protein